MTQSNIEFIKKSISPLRQEIIDHPLFRSIETLEDLTLFMEHHVFAVWDFMTLLKTLQSKLTCVTTPWVPVGDRLSRRLINEIVLGEESDEHPEGGFASHYELYLEAMNRLGADTKPVADFVQRISKKEKAKNALDISKAPEGVKPFVSWTLEMSERPVHEVASAFTFGREDLIPDLFRNVVKGLEGRFPELVGLLLEYLERHIDLDENSHSPLAYKMLDVLCADDPKKWEEARLASIDALNQRKKLWDAVLIILEKKKALASS